MLKIVKLMERLIKNGAVGGPDSGSVHGRNDKLLASLK
jgi:hypothetical protein